MDGSLVKYLKKTYSKKELKILRNMLTNEGIIEITKYILDGDLDLNDIDCFNSPYEDIPIYINKKDIFSSIVLKWRLSIGH